jgi:tripartite-type tricarboxylate transporter receptor subunit TctC
VPQIQSGKLRAFGVSSARRASSLPDVPTMQELGLRDFDISQWQGVLAPAGTPGPIIERLNTEIVRIVKTPDMQNRLRTLGLTPTGTSAEHLSKELASDYAYWGKIVRELNVKVE